MRPLRKALGWLRVWAERPDGRHAVGAWLLLWGITCVLLVPVNADPNQTDWTGRSFFDYRDTVWMPIRDFLHGGVPWDTVNYLQRHPGIQDYLLYVPLYWWLTFPLALMPYQSSIVVWLAVTCASLVLLVWLGLSLAGNLQERFPWLLECLVIGSLVLRPVRSALFQGQFALPCAAAAMYALVRVRDGSRASVLATTVAIIKPPVAVPLLLIQAITRQFRSPLRALGLAAALSLPIALVVMVRLGGLPEAVEVAVRSLGNGSGTVMSAAPSYTDLRGRASLAWPGAILPQLLALALSLVITIPGYLAAYRRWGAESTYAVVLASLVMMLVAPTMLYAAVVTIPGMILLAHDVLASLHHRRARPAVVSLAALGLLLVPALVPGRAFVAVGLTSAQSGHVTAVAYALAAGIMSISAVNHARSDRPLEPLRGDA